jgi:hypothetical protein
VPFFTCPTIADVPRVLPESRGPGMLLMRHYRNLSRGRSVLKVAGHYTTVDVPTTDQLVAAGQEGTGYFLGGHVYSVTDTVATALAADGYSTSADLVVPSDTLTWGFLSGLTWDEFVDSYGTWG